MKCKIIQIKINYVKESLLLNTIVKSKLIFKNIFRIDSYKLYFDFLKVKDIIIKKYERF